MRRPIYSRYEVRKDSNPDRKFCWYVASQALDDRFEFGSFLTHAEAFAAAYQWACEGVDTTSYQ